MWWKLRSTADLPSEFIVLRVRPFYDSLLFKVTLYSSIAHTLYSSTPWETELLLLWGLMQPFYCCRRQWSCALEPSLNCICLDTQLSCSDEDQQCLRNWLYSPFRNYAYIHNITLHVSTYIRLRAAGPLWVFPRVLHNAISSKIGRLRLPKTALNGAFHDKTMRQTQFVTKETRQNGASHRKTKQKTQSKAAQRIIPRIPKLQLHPPSLSRS